MLYRNNLWLSNKAASQSLLLAHNQSKPNIIFYSRGRWDYGASGPAHISAAYDTGFLDDNLNGVELVSGSTHTVKISSTQPSITSGEIVITDT